MAAARKTSRKKTKPKHARKAKRTKAKKTSRAKKASPRRPVAHKKRIGAKEDVTYVYECTRPGCGYRIVRDEKMETGQLRTDLKCPKCHHVEFRCLGQGDLPEDLQISIPLNPVDLDAVRPSSIASN